MSDNMTINGGHPSLCSILFIKLQISQAKTDLSLIETPDLSPLKLQIIKICAKYSSEYGWTSLTKVFLRKLWNNSLPIFRDFDILLVHLFAIFIYFAEPPT